MSKLTKREIMSNNARCHLDDGVASLNKAMDAAEGDKATHDYMVRVVLPSLVRLNSVVKKWPRHE